MWRNDCNAKEEQLCGCILLHSSLHAASALLWVASAHNVIQRQWMGVVVWGVNKWPIKGCSMEWGDDLVEQLLTCLALICSLLCCPRIDSVRCSDLLCIVSETLDNVRTYTSKKHWGTMTTRLANVSYVPEAQFERKLQLQHKEGIFAKDHASLCVQNSSLRHMGKEKQGGSDTMPERGH